MVIRWVTGRNVPPRAPAATEMPTRATARDAPFRHFPCRAREGAPGRAPEDVKAGLTTAIGPARYN